MPAQDDLQDEPADEVPSALTEREKARRRAQGLSSVPDFPVPRRRDESIDQLMNGLVKQVLSPERAPTAPEPSPAANVLAGMHSLEPAPLEVGVPAPTPRPLVDTVPTERAARRRVTTKVLGPAAGIALVVTAVIVSAISLFSPQAARRSAPGVTSARPPQAAAVPPPRPTGDMPSAPAPPETAVPLAPRTEAPPPAVIAAQGQAPSERLTVAQTPAAASRLTKSPMHNVAAPAAASSHPATSRNSDEIDNAASQEYYLK